MGNELQAVKHHPFYEALQEWFAGNPEISTIASYTGMKLVSTDTGRAVITFRTDKGFSNVTGTLQGGMLTTVADAAMGLAFFCALRETEGFTTLELKVNFLRPVSSGTLLRFEAVVAHRGKTAGLVNCNVSDEKGRLVAQCSSTCMVIRQTGSSDIG